MFSKEKVNSKGLTEEEFLRNYKPGNYERPSVTVDMLLFTVSDKENEDIRKVAQKELKMLLIKRKDHPFINQWAIPGGFVGIKESLDEAVARELKEETNVENIYFEQLYTYGDVNRDPRMRVISVAHLALVPSENLNPIAGDDADKVAWFSIRKDKVVVEEGRTLYKLIIENTLENINIVYDIVEEIELKGVSRITKTSYSIAKESNNSLAFDHYKIIDAALERLKNKVEYTSIAFNLVSKYFTLTELQKVYEVILNKKLQKTAFRRKITSMVEETEEKTNDVGFRPAKLYKFNNHWNHEF